MGEPKAKIRVTDVTFTAHFVEADPDPAERAMNGRPCPDCGAAIGSLHAPGCDIEQCPDCGGQLLFDDCSLIVPDDARRIPWTGRMNGSAEAEEYGIDIMRLMGEGEWDAEARRWTWDAEGGKARVAARKAARTPAPSAP